MESQPQILNSGLILKTFAHVSFPSLPADTCSGSLKYIYHRMKSVKVVTSKSNLFLCEAYILLRCPSNNYISQII